MAIENARRGGESLSDVLSVAKRPRRPGFGDRGRKVALFANFFRMRVGAGIVFHYGGLGEGVWNYFASGLWFGFLRDWVCANV